MRDEVYGRGKAHSRGLNKAPKEKKLQYQSPIPPPKHLLFCPTLSTYHLLSSTLPALLLTMTELALVHSLSAGPETTLGLGGGRCAGTSKLQRSSVRLKSFSF